MMSLLVATFVIAYAAIALEHPLGINKSATALIAAGTLWTIYALASGGAHQVADELNTSLMATAQIVFFLIGAMTIVEVVDAHDGFEVITTRINTTRLSTLMGLVGMVTFFLSSILDNLTTTIVMVSLMKKLLAVREDRLLFAGIIVIAANAGGAWTPIGDVTTTMLWIGGQITSLPLMRAVFWPSMVSLLVPLALTTWAVRGRPVVTPPRDGQVDRTRSSPFEKNLMFCLGLGKLCITPKHLCQ